MKKYGLLGVVACVVSLPLVAVVVVAFVAVLPGVAAVADAIAVAAAPLERCFSVSLLNSVEVDLNIIVTLPRNLSVLLYVCMYVRMAYVRTNE